MSPGWGLGTRFWKCSDCSLDDKDGLLCLLLQITWIILNICFAFGVPAKQSVYMTSPKKNLETDSPMGFPGQEHCRLQIHCCICIAEGKTAESCDPSWEGDCRRKPALDSSGMCLCFSPGNLGLYPYFVTVINLSY